RLLVFEECEAFLDGEVEHVVNILSVVLYFQNLLLEPLSMARFAFQVDVGHELHLDLDLAFSLTRFASPALNVEGKERGLVTALDGQGLICEQLPDRVVRL